jgi:hypothetical protein
VTEFQSERPKLKNGQPVYTVQLVLLGEEEAFGKVQEAASLIKVKVVGKPADAIRQGMAVKATGLVATPWEMKDGSHGISFEAEAIQPLSGPKAQTS